MISTLLTLGCYNFPKKMPIFTKASHLVATVTDGEDRPLLLALGEESLSFHV